MLSALTGRVKCLFGYHIGPWLYENPADCTQTSACERCGARSRRIEHQWGAFAVEYACTMFRTCARCPRIDFRYEHDWMEPPDDADRADHDYLICRHCGDSHPN